MVVNCNLPNGKNNLEYKQTKQPQHSKAFKELLISKPLRKRGMTSLAHDLVYTSTDSDQLHAVLEWTETLGFP